VTTARPLLVHVATAGAAGREKAETSFDQRSCIEITRCAYRDVLELADRATPALAGP
jgi:hypothetical protein